ncbi:MAG: dipeptide epimerase [Caulobacteraceae bacterium]
MTASPSLSLTLSVETFPLTRPFRISGHTFTDAAALVARARAGAARGRGEAAGVYYLGEEPQSMARQLEAHREDIEAGLSRQDARRLLPAGGARNALDCALWELEAGLTGRPVWRLTGGDEPRPLVTTFTLGADSPEHMVEGAVRFGRARALKVKLTGEEAALDAERVRAVRAARPEVWMGVDANQGYTPDTLEALLPALVAGRVAVLEQPFARGREADMEGLGCPIPIAADESALELGDIEGLVGRFDILNIKRDKCGGLTEALLMAAEARRLGLGVMVGCMVGTSWAMAPAFVLGQLCDIVDLDGPVLLANDRRPGALYEDGLLRCPDEVWGAPD